MRVQVERSCLLAGAVVLLLLALAPSPASAAFGFRPGGEGFAVSASAEGGVVPDTEAGSHPYALTTEINLELAGEIPGRPGVPASDGDLRDLQLELPAGLIEDPAALGRCSAVQFATPRSSPFEASRSGESCPDDSQVGVVAVHSSVEDGSTRSFGLFNLVAPPGSPSQLGFAPYGVPITFTPHLRQAEGEYGLTLDSRNLPQSLDIYGLRLTVWGTPWAISHNTQRGDCLKESEPDFGWAKCAVRDEAPTEAYLTLPTSCAAPLIFTATADSWQEPGSYLPGGEPDLSESAWQRASSTSGPLEGCQGLGFGPVASTVATNDRTSSATGLDFDLESSDAGLLEPAGRAQSPVRRAVVALPEGLTINPSLGAGLGVCTAAQYGAESLGSPPGAGCPNDSKIGDFSLQTPLLEGVVKGSLFLARPFENPFGSVLAVYLVTSSPERGIIVKVAGQIAADPATGRLTASFEDLPQLPYSHLAVEFREGQRAPLVAPAACGAYSSQIDLVPWNEPGADLHQTSSVQVGAGIGGGACPGATPPFAPGAQAGTLNAAAGAYTPFYLHLTRTDGEAEITSYSATFPPGLLGNLSGIPYCPDAAIEAAKRETGAGEEAHPSCPAASEIGHTVSGFGVGGVLAYAPGRLYLAGPFHGSPFSIVAIDAATVGPIDLGTIVVRSAIEVDPQSAQVRIDSAGSDPIPHILDGIPLHLRDIRIYISRPHFTINPTSCDPFSVVSTLTGSSAPFTDPRGASATATVPFHVSDCSALGFAPQLSLSLKGGTRRGDFPSLHATLLPRAGNANLSAAAVTLPRSEFLEQSHIGIVCPRPKLEAEACPKGSAYGRVSAVTPLLGQPLEGPVYLGTGYGHPLPDLVAVLHGDGLRFVLDGRIDSDHGGIRGTFTGLPDAPVTSFTMILNGGKHGILVNERNICTSPETGVARFSAQDDSADMLHPRLTDPSCRKHPHHRHGSTKGHKKGSR